MDNKIIFIQSTELGGDTDKNGLSDIFISHLQENKKNNIFEQIKVIVPNQALGIWLKDRITQEQKICANVDFVALLGPVIQQIYLVNNPDAEMYDFNQLKFVIYKILCNHKIDCVDANEINNYLYLDGVVDKFKAFQLASQLQRIFLEYLYLRTYELSKLTNSYFKEWQKIIWQMVNQYLAGQKTYVDIYKYFAELDIENTQLILPSNLFIFGLTSVYPSQLAIMQKLSHRMTIYWYYQACSNEDYSDLLSVKARSHIEKKLLRKPNLSIEDLYLTDGNPLIANCGQQSREFIELLRANEIEVYNFTNEPSKPISSDDGLLVNSQQDIRDLVYRIRPEYRLDNSITSYYAEPIKLKNHFVDENCFYDLSATQLSFKVNVCHNRMREVQVMFNEVAQFINENPTVGLNEILITAPDIDNYATHIHAVFENERLVKHDGTQLKIPYLLTGNRRHKNYKILETVKLMLLAPYRLTVNYLMEIISQSELQTNLELGTEDIELVKTWLSDNKVHFGYSADDYTPYGYDNYSIHSFEQFLTNLSLGSCLSNEILTDKSQLMIFHSNSGDFTPYDNIDNAQINLANKILTLIKLLADLRSALYSDVAIYREFSIVELLQLMELLKAHLINDDDSLLVFNNFIGTLRSQEPELVINLPILLQLIDEHMDEVKSKLNFNGKITCASMQYMRNIPFKYIYILGLNFGEFPRSYSPNQLSILAKDWYIADRNYTTEDKQVFLDIILAAKYQLRISYIGRKETDNSLIKPSPLLSLLLNTIGQSFSNFWQGDDLIYQKFNFKNMLTYHALHPFYNNVQLNYAGFWQQVANKASSDNTRDLRWDFTQVSPLKLNPEQERIYFNLSFKQLLSTFLYSNVNLYRVLGNNRFDNDIELDDYESLEILNYDLAKILFNYFEEYPTSDTASLQHFLQLKGVLGYQHIGQQQFEHYFQLYQFYIACRGNKLQEIKFEYQLQRVDGSKITLSICDNVWLDGSNLIVMDSFSRCCKCKVEDKVENLSYELKWQALIYASLIAQQKDNGVVNNIDQVLVRQFDQDGKCREFSVRVNDYSIILRRIMGYYARSLTNPVLIHRSALNEYVKASRECYANGKLKNTPEKILARTHAKYSADWQNYDLDKIKIDPIFSQIATDYFAYIEKVNGVNDIVQLGNILLGLGG